MINLIPKEEKKKMTIDFYYRLSILFLITLSICILILSISILPSYFISSAQNALIVAKLETQKKEPLPPLGEQSLSIVKDIDSKLDLVENSEKNRFLISAQVINSIILNKRPDIKITKIFYENSAINGKKISITGTAPSRGVLLSFSQALEDSLAFKNIDLPVSNFIKGSNIQFYLNLVPRLPDGQNL